MPLWGHLSVSSTKSLDYYHAPLGITSLSVVPNHLIIATPLWGPTPIALNHMIIATPLWGSTPVALNHVIIATPLWGSTLSNPQHVKLATTQYIHEQI